MDHARFGAQVPSTRLPHSLASAHEGALDKAYREEQPRLKRYFDWKASPADRLENPAGYLWRIAQNLVIDTMRVRSRRGPHALFDETQHSPDFADQSAILEGVQLQLRYEKALAALPTRTRDIFLMHRIDELTYQEIAVAMGLSSAGVEYHMSKALAHLAKRLGVQR